MVDGNREEHTMQPIVLLYHVPACRFVGMTWESGATNALDSIVSSTPQASGEQLVVGGIMRASHAQGPPVFHYPLATLSI